MIVDTTSLEKHKKSFEFKLFYI